MFNEYREIGRHNIQKLYDLMNMIDILQTYTVTDKVGNEYIDLFNKRFEKMKMNFLQTEKMKLIQLKNNLKGNL